MMLNPEQYNRQMNYETALFFFGQMLNRNIISEAEFADAKKFIEKKYDPIIQH